MTTAGGCQLTLFQCCISDVDDDPGTKCVRLSTGTDEDQIHQSSNSDADSEPPNWAFFVFFASQMNLCRVCAIFLVIKLTILHLKTLLGLLF